MTWAEDFPGSGSELKNKYVTILSSWWIFHDRSPHGERYI